MKDGDVIDFVQAPVTLENNVKKSIDSEESSPVDTGDTSTYLQLPN